MFDNISVFHFLIYAAGVGFAAAIVYTNIQRTAYSRFFNYLLDSNCFSAQTAKKLDDMGLNSLHKKIISSAVKHQYGFKKVVKTVGGEKKRNDIEALFDECDDTLYYLENADIELLRKKYTFKTMPARLVVLFVAALAVVVIIASYSVSWLIKKVTTPKLEETTDTEQQEEVDETGTEPGDDELPEFTVPDEPESPEIPVEDNSGDKAAGPRIPV